MAQLAEPAVSFLLQSITNFLSKEYNLLQGVGDEVQELESELKFMHALLKDAEPKQHDAAIVKEWISQSRELAYEADDVLDKFAVNIGSGRRGGTANALKRYACILNEFCLRHRVGVEIQSLRTRVSTINKKFQDHGIRAILDKEGSSSSQQQLLRRTYSRLEEDDFVGLDSDVQMLVQQLVNEKMGSQQGVVSIRGMGGLGKTTIARRVYNNANVARSFSGRAWICVSQQWQAKDILQGILIKLMPEKKEDVRHWNYDELVRELSQVQQERRCLFVLDDIWETDAWDAIRPAFSLKHQGSKILVTTRNKEVAQHIDPNGFHLELRFLSEDESYELLQKKALRRRYAEGNEDIKKLEDVGKKVAGQCGGLPLAVVVVAGILATKSTLREWEHEYQNIHSIFGKGKGNRFEEGEVQKILGLSYNDLPYQLKFCFLYLGGFPEDSEIDAETIYQLWMAEGFLPTMDDAESALGELAERCMVLVRLEDQFSTRRRFESCRLHDLMRDLCLLKAEEENFMKVIDYSSSHGSSSLTSSLSNKFHRLAIHEKLEDYLRGYVPPGKKMTQHLRMLWLLFSGDPYMYGVLPTALRSRLKNSKMLRILCLENVGYHFKLSHLLGKLVLLRYLSLRGCRFSALLPSLGNLIHLQTLDLRETITRDIWFPNALVNMRELKYLYLPSSLVCRRKKPCKLRLDALSKLEILENFSSSDCEIGDLWKLSNLRVFTVKACRHIDDLATIADYISRSDSLQYTSIKQGSDLHLTASEKWPLVLQKLLLARSMQYLHILGRVGKFPKFEVDSTISAGIVKIILLRSGIDEDPMEILEKLPYLRELVLDEAWVEEMACQATGFPQLRSLTLREFWNLRIWNVEKGAMPNLSSLHLSFLPSLNELPDGLKFIETLKDIQYVGVRESLEEQIKALSNMGVGVLEIWRPDLVDLIYQYHFSLPPS